jgi:hypothetical protein
MNKLIVLMDQLFRWAPGLEYVLARLALIFIVIMLLVALIIALDHIKGARKVIAIVGEGLVIATALTATIMYIGGTILTWLAASQLGSVVRFGRVNPGDLTSVWIVTAVVACVAGYQMRDGRMQGTEASLLMLIALTGAGISSIGATSPSIFAIIMIASTLIAVLYATFHHGKPMAVSLVEFVGDKVSTGGRRGRSEGMSVAQLVVAGAVIAAIVGGAIWATNRNSSNTLSSRVLAASNDGPSEDSCGCLVSTVNAAVITYRDEACQSVMVTDPALVPERLRHYCKRSR